MSISSTGDPQQSVQLCGLSFENFKAFPSLENIEVRPLTVLIGRNSSGKSVVSRLPLLIASGLSAQAEGPLELQIPDVDFGRSYVDLIHNRKRYGEIGIGASFRTSTSDLSKFFVRLQHFDEYKMFAIKDFMHSDGNSPEMQIEWLGQDPRAPSQTYRLTCGSIVVDPCTIEFHGLWPKLVQPLESDPDVAEVLQRLRENRATSSETMDWIPDFISALKKGPLWQITERLWKTAASFNSVMDSITYLLGPFRKDPARDYRYPGRTPRGVGSRGGNAPDLLGHDALRSKGQTLSLVSQWFETHLGGWALDVDQQKDTFSLVLRDPRDPDVAVNIVDVGAGIAQVLPIVVQKYFKSHSAIEIVEQPELHLHPAAHCDVADLYVEAIKSSGARFLIETHSENFILRLRRRIAEGKLSKDDVIIYWIEDRDDSESRITPIHIDKDGGVDRWPKSVFSEDFEEVRAIRQANRRSED